ncbi:uncharacterized protein LOC143050712 [Mytilus galloprovincialis]|uniref:uncharacterized protein LOC143050712 n=1 Tax=Mytilus galloprovincialis TaxID=29158 RepID=UPI003F7C534A
MYTVNWFLLVINICNFFIPGLSYSLTCPDRSHRRHRQNAYCFEMQPEYVCLKDLNKLKDIELCEISIDFQRPGYKMVYRGNIDGEKCDIKRYQPFRYFNSDGSNCIFQKSICKEEGQITIVKGSSKSDSKCTCDYTNGYTFITKTSNKCYCSPAEEDCSCYRKHCPHRYELSPDYQCVLKEDFLEDSFYRHYNCTRLIKWTFSINDMKVTRQQNAVHDQDKRHRLETVSSISYGRHERSAGIYVIQCLVLFCIGIICFKHRVIKLIAQSSNLIIMKINNVENRKKSQKSNDIETRKAKKITDSNSSIQINL